MGKRETWNKGSMIAAVNAVKEKTMGYKTASKWFNFPRATLKDYVKSELSAEKCMQNIVGRSPVLPEALDKLLFQYCLEMENNYYGLTIDNLRRMAYQVVRKLQVANLFAEGYQCAATLQTAVNGFKKTGIMPFNPEIFTEDQFPSPNEVVVVSEKTRAEETPAQPMISPKDLRQVPVIQSSTSNRRGTILVTETPYKK
ncbi:hypothetical protein PR048_020874 [Dryococelus australis]|uniref:HTH psq-type domain-containing protein n=1 Tax=Dryococelus australis TaxID=614101 RepID=A0ABQ9GWQ7_9NEOP|nr:hypothetical protein PR048_020874 [Dryococelus australis]